MKLTKHGSIYKRGLLLVFVLLLISSADQAVAQTFYPINQPKTDDRIFHAPLTVNMGRFRPNLFDPLKEVYNLVCIYNESGVLKITTDLSFSRDAKLKSKKGFIVITYPVTVDTSPSNPPKPKVLSHVAMFTPKVEYLNGNVLDSKWQIPADQTPAFKENVKQLGLPLGNNRYAFNLYGAKGEIKFNITDTGEIVNAELVDLNTNASHFTIKGGAYGLPQNDGYRTSDGIFLPLTVITVE
ncbi:MAG: hypothetical protein NT178_07005 [Proteobacteria bacterium]|nr:hypothetical protein [Pseudomonadota bacterium]